jgi:hypothetical protein
MTLIYVYESYGNDLICMLRVCIWQSRGHEGLLAVVGV